MQIYALGAKERHWTSLGPVPPELQWAPRVTGVPAWVSERILAVKRMLANFIVAGIFKISVLGCCVAVCVCDLSLKISKSKV